MDLDELKRKLYQKNGKLKDEPRSPEAFEPGHQPDPALFSQEPAGPIEPSPRGFFIKLKEFFRKYFLAGAVLVLLVVLIVAAVLFFLGRQFFDKSLVFFEIYGPERVMSGEKITLKAMVKNNSKTSLLSPRIIFVLPEESVFEDGESTRTVFLNDLKSSSQDAQELKARIIGRKGQQKTIQARLLYSPRNISSQFENEDFFDIFVAQAPLAINLDLPSVVTSGQSLNLAVQYTNDSEIDFPGLELRIDYPEGFSFDSAYPLPVEQSNIWRLDALNSNTEKKIVIAGHIVGNEQEVKTFSVQLGEVKDGDFLPLAQLVKSCQIGLSPLSLWQKVNDSDNYVASRGEKLTFEIRYKNTSQEIIKGVVITSRLSGEIFEPASIAVRDGSFSTSADTVSWNEAGVPSLAFLNPGQEGTVSFSVKLKQNIPIEGYQDKNFILENKAMIDSPNVPLSLLGVKLGGESIMRVKLKTELVLNVRGYFYDDTFQNSGPLPPCVGQTTTYTVFWEALNYFNDAGDVKVETFLPPYIKWLGRVSPQGSQMSYDASSGRLVWAVGTLPAGTGMILPVKSVAFQIALVPSASQAGKAAELLKESFISGQDLFVEQELKEGAEGFSSDLPDDSGVDGEKGKVAE